MSLLKLEGLFGRLGADPEEQANPKGGSRLTAPVVVNLFKGGEEKAVWIRVTAFDEGIKRRMAAAKKGSAITFRGDLDPRAYLDKSGEPAPGLDVVLTDFDFIPIARRDDDNTAERTPVAAGARRGPSRPMGGFDDDDNTVPF
jgi:single-stranded DNA-binding protein